MMKTWYFLICFLGLVYKLLETLILFYGLIENKIDGFKYVTSANFEDYGLPWRRAKVPVLFGNIFKGSYFFTCSCTRLLKFRDKFRTESESRQHFFAC